MNRKQKTGAKIGCSWREYHSLQVKNGESVVHCWAQLPDLLLLFRRLGAINNVFGGGKHKQDSCCCKAEREEILGSYKQVWIFSSACSVVEARGYWSNKNPGCLGGKVEWVLKAEKINFYSCNCDSQEWIYAFTELFPLCAVKASLTDSLSSKYCPQGIVSNPIIMMSAIGKLYSMEKLASSHLIYILHNYSVILESHLCLWEENQSVN